MLNFKKPEIADREWVQKLYECSGFRGAEYTFANLYLWSYFYGEIAKYQDHLCQRLTFQGMHQYIFPAGCGEKKPVLDRLWQDSREAGKPFVVRSLTKETMAIMQELYPDQFTYEETRNAFDYLYEIDTLCELAGKKYQAKRNHINRFIDANPDWHTEIITDDNLHICKDLADKWYETHPDSAADSRALEKAFTYRKELKFEGLILYGNDGPVAFSMGNRISFDTFDVNFEKAFADVQGAYPLVNREFARLVRAAYPDIRYLNREDDMGLENLRKAKESYHPIFLEKYIAKEIMPSP